MSDQVFVRYQYFCFFKLFIFICGFFGTVTSAFLATAMEIRLTLAESGERRYFCSDLGFKGTIVNLELPSLHGRSNEITLTVPLKEISKILKNPCKEK